MATTHGYVPEEEVIGAAGQAAGDPTLGAVGYPVYRSLLSRSLERMAFEVPWDERRKDEAMPANGILPLPTRMAGMDGLWVYNGPTCDPANAMPVVLKEGYSHAGGPQGFQRIYWRGSSLFAPHGHAEPPSLLYAGVRAGALHLSPQCRSYARLRLHYRGIGHDPDDRQTPMQVPLFARQAITDHVTIMALEHRIYTEGKERLFMARYQDKMRECFGIGGTWHRAKMDFGQMDRQDMLDTNRLTYGIGYH